MRSEPGSPARPDVYVSGDLFIYYEEGNPRVSVVPDVFVVFGAEKRRRRVYKLWEEPKAPDFVLEVASPHTWREDEGPKRVVYERLGVREYFQHDPMGDLLPSRLQGRRLVRGVFEPVSVVASLDGTLLAYSEALGLELLADRDGELRFRDPETGRVLPCYEETEAAREREAVARKREAAARRKAESRADAAESRAEAAESRAETAESRAEASESRVAELEALLDLRRN